MTLLKRKWGPWYEWATRILFCPPFSNFQCWRRKLHVHRVLLQGRPLSYPFPVGFSLWCMQVPDKLQSFHREPYDQVSKKMMLKSWCDVFCSSLVTNLSFVFVRFHSTRKIFQKMDHNKHPSSLKWVHLLDCAHYQQSFLLGMAHDRSFISPQINLGMPQLWPPRRCIRWRPDVQTFNW